MQISIHNYFGTYYIIFRLKHWNMSPKFVFSNFLSGYSSYFMYIDYIIVFAYICIMFHIPKTFILSFHTRQYTNDIEHEEEYADGDDWK